MLKTETEVEMNRRFRFGSLVALAGLITLAGCDYAPRRTALAQVLDVAGEVFLVGDSAATASTRRPLTRDNIIRPGQSVETSQNGTAVISLLPGMALQLNPDTTLAIDELLVAKSGTATMLAMRVRQARVRLIRGSLYATTPFTAKQTELRVETPVGTLVAPALTCFYVSTTPDTVRATIADGQLSFRGKAGGAARTLNEWYYQEWSIGTGATTSEPRLVETDPEAFQQWTEARDAESRALNLTSRLVNSLPGRGCL